MKPEGKSMTVTVSGWLAGSSNIYVAPLNWVGYVCMYTLVRRGKKPDVIR